MGNYFQSKILCPTSHVSVRRNKVIFQNNLLQCILAWISYWRIQSTNKRFRARGSAKQQSGFVFVLKRQQHSRVREYWRRSFLQHPWSPHLSFPHSYVPLLPMNSDHLFLWERYFSHRLAVVKWLFLGLQEEIYCFSLNINWINLGLRSALCHQLYVLGKTSTHKLVKERGPPTSDLCDSKQAI